MRPYISDYMQKYYMKKKYYDKLLSTNAMMNVYLRTIDVEDLVQRNIWLQIAPFDLAQLGIGLILSISGFEFDALMLSFIAELPEPDELMRGILVKFEPADLTSEFPELGNVDLQIQAWFPEEFRPKTLEKAQYSVSQYDASYYDPMLFREVITSTLFKLRQMNPSDPLYKQIVEELAEMLEVSTYALWFVSDKISLLMAAQEQTFILGLGVLGYSRLQEKEGRFIKIKFTDHDGVEHEVKVRHLSDLLLGFILGITPLGYGLLLPDREVLKLEEDKYNPRLVESVTTKASIIRDSIPFLPFSFSNYQTFKEMADVHANQRVSQYDALMHIRKFIEYLVEMRIPPEERNPVTVRQYQNAVLQYFGWLTKRHAWGMDAFRQMAEDEYVRFWIGYWTAQGLKESTLQSLYEVMKLWKRALIRERVRLGELIQKYRKGLPPM
ncbi:MAG: hypothetical protein QW512_00335 [Thermofilaceae archaeon]